MITWNNEKDRWLRKKRGVSFTVAAEIIEMREYLDILLNPAYNGQYIFIIRYNNYTYAVPFEYDDQDNILLKTIYPSRKYNRIYGINS
jgi:hypothetical protein